MSVVWGPEDPSLWLTRALGHWETQLVDWPPVTPGSRRCTCNSVTHITTEQQIDLHLWEESVRATVYRQPHLRTDINLGEVHHWVPATDFSQVFSYQDLRGGKYGNGSIGGVWSLVESEANRAWQYGSGKPLYRNTLLRVIGGYMVMNCYHHAAGDGTTGMIVMGSILEIYNRLLRGEEISLTSLVPRPCMEELTQIHDTEATVDRMLAEKITRAMKYTTVLPYCLQSLKDNREMEEPTNSCLWREGGVQEYKRVRARCREEGVTVGALALAAAYMAQGVTHALSLPHGDEWNGLTGLLVDIPVNIRERVEPPMVSEYAGFYITEITTKTDLNPTTTLWSLARELADQLKVRMMTKEHMHFTRTKLHFETGDNAEIAASVPPEKIVDLLYSNMRAYPFPLDHPWGRVRSIHCPGSYWSPGFANYVLLIQSTDIFTYDLVYCPGDKNSRTATSILNITVSLIEEAGDPGLDPTIKELIMKERKMLPSHRNSCHGE